MLVKKHKPRKFTKHFMFTWVMVSFCYMSCCLKQCLKNSAEKTFQFFKAPTGYESLKKPNKKTLMLIT
jgi:hypothetical protein